MIFVFVALAIPTALFLPWWVLPVIAAGFGYWAKTEWRQAVLAALLLLVLETAIAYYFDEQDHGLISKRLGGVFSIPYPVIWILPGILGGIVALFFTRLGGSFRQLISRET